MTNITKGIRLLFPIKDMAHGEAVQDLLFANRERSFESITFLHVVDKDLMVSVVLSRSPFCMLWIRI